MKLKDAIKKGDDTMKTAQEELLKSGKKNITLYDRRAKRREF